MTLNFYIRFHTQFGQVLYVSGNCAALGNYDDTKAVAMQFLNDKFCHCQVEIPATDIDAPIEYHYILKNADGTEVIEWKDDKQVDFSEKHLAEISVFDSWNHAGTIENAFYTKPFKEVFLKINSVVKQQVPDIITSHEFKVKCPLLKENEVVCLIGNHPLLHSWDTTTPLLLTRAGDWWKIKLNLTNSGVDVAYKYGIYNIATNVFIKYELGDNRMFTDKGGKGTLTIFQCFPARDQPPVAGL